MKRYSSNKDINQAVVTLERIGWKYVKKGKHGAIISPIGRKLFVPGTPSDFRSFQNFKRDIRQIQRVE